MNNKIRIIRACLIFGILLLVIMQFVAASFIDNWIKSIDRAKGEINDKVQELQLYKSKLISCGLDETQANKVMAVYQNDSSLRTAVREAVSNGDKYILDDIPVENLKKGFYLPGIITQTFEGLFSAGKANSGGWFDKSLAWIGEQIDWLFGLTVKFGIVMVGLVVGGIGFAVGFFIGWSKKTQYWEGGVSKISRGTKQGTSLGLLLGSCLMFLVFLFFGGVFKEMLLDFGVGLMTAGILILTLFLERLFRGSDEYKVSKAKKLEWLRALVWVDSASITTTNRLLRIFKYLTKPLTIGFLYAILTHIPVISAIFKYLTLYWFAPYFIKPILLAVIIGYLPEIGRRIIAFKREKAKQEKLNQVKVAAQVIKDLGDYR